MKKSALAITVFFLYVSTSFSQIEKGAWMAGGNAGFTSAKDVNSFFLNPKIGYFFSKNLVAGLDFSYYNPGSLVSVGPFFRGYLTFGSMSLFAQTRLAINTGEGIGSAVGFGAGPGIGYFLNDYVALEAVAEFSVPDLGKTDESSFGTLIGFQVYFNRKQ